MASADEYDSGIVGRRCAGGGEMALVVTAVEPGVGDIAVNEDAAAWGAQESSVVAVHSAPAAAADVRESAAEVAVLEYPAVAA